MQQMKASDFHPEVLRLFDQFVHGIIDRRSFISGAGKYAAAGVTGSMLLDLLAPNFAMAQKVAKDDSRIVAKYVDVDSPNGYGKIRGYLVAPAGATGKLKTVLVAHENRGLNPHIEDIARRLALDGFLAFAPDALTSMGGYPGEEDKAREAFGKLDQAKVRADFLAAEKFLKSQPNSNGKIGAVGFCWGGGMVNYLAIQLPDLAAAVPFYGTYFPPAEAEKVKAPMLLHFAGLDERINAMWPPFEEALKAHKAKYEAFVYPGVQHGFNNDTTPRFDEAAAKLAWQRTLDFFRAKLA